MKKCSNSCEPACDFCIFFEKKNDGEIGHCTKLNSETMEAYHCEHFHCFRAES